MKILSFDVFKKQIELIKTDFKLIDESVTKMIDNNPFICDGGGVANDWLLNIIVHSLENLFYAVNPNISKPEMENLIDYYVWENNFGGIIDEKDLSDDRLLYDYLKEIH